MPPIASRQGDAASTLRLLAYLALAIVLIVLDDQGGWLSRLRAQAGMVVQPVWALAGVPGQVGASVRDNAVSHNQLVAENRTLRNELLLANARLTRLQAAALDIPSDLCAAITRKAEGDFRLVRNMMLLLEKAAKAAECFHVDEAMLDTALSARTWRRK